MDLLDPDDRSRARRHRGGLPVRVSGLTIDGPQDPLVRDLSFEAPAGEVTIVPCDPGPPQVAIALALAGRVELDSGGVTIAGTHDPARLQELVRVVDVDQVSSPEESLPLPFVVSEELALANQHSGRSNVREFLDARDLRGHWRDRWDSVPAGERIRMLLDLAALDATRQVLVLAGPDRHGTHHREWLDHARKVAADGRTVIVLVNLTTAEALDAAPSASREDLP